MASRSARSLVVFAATRTPALRSSLVAFCEVAVPNTGPPHARAPAASTQDFPVPAGNHLAGPGRGQHMPDRRSLIQPQPAARTVLARVLRALTQLRRQQLR